MTATLSKTVADFETTLASGVSIGATTCTLTSATDDDGVALPTGTYALTVDVGNTQKEYFVATVTGTAVTNVVSITRQGATSTGFTRAHRRGSNIVLTDWVILKRLVNLLDGTTDWDASTPIKYDGTATLSSNNHLATVGYVLSVVTGGTVTFDKQVIAVTAGETIVTNDLVYLKESDSRWWKVDADTSSTTDGTVTGIAISGNTAGNSFSVQVSGIVTGLSGLTANSKYYASGTAGALSLTAGTNELFIGYALTTTTLFLAQRSQDMPTAKEKDALVGTQGIPSSSNLYVTNDNLSVGEIDQSQTTQNSSIEFGEASASGRKNKVAQSFIAGKTKVRGIELYKKANAGTFTGTVTVSIQANDVTNIPSGSALVSKTFTNAQYLAIDPSTFQALFTTEYTSLVIGTTYWIVVESSTSDNTNHPNIATNSAGGYSSGSVKYYNGTDNWVAVATIDLYFKVLEGVKNQVLESDSSGLIGVPFTEFSQKIIGITSNQSGEWIVAHRSFMSHIPTGAATNAIFWTVPAGVTLDHDVATMSLSADAMLFSGGTSSASAELFPNILNSISSPIQFNYLTAENKIVMETSVYIRTLTDGDFFVGLGSNNGNITYNSGASDDTHIGVIFRSDGNTYLQTSNNTSVTATLSTGQFLPSIPFGSVKFVRVRIELDPTSQARLYLNGYLAASHATNLPASAGGNHINIKYLFNELTTGTLDAVVTAPTVAMRFA